MSKVNHLAVVAAAVVHFLLGAAWFTGFAAAWSAGLHMSPEQLAAAQAHPSPLPYAVAFLCNLAIAYALAWVLGRTGQQTMFRGLQAGFVLGLGVAAAAMVTELAFEYRSPVFIAISAGYPLVGMTLMGGIVGVWKRKAPADLSQAAGAAR